MYWLTDLSSVYLLSIDLFTYLPIFFLKNFIVIQLQLSAFSIHLFSTHPSIINHCTYPSTHSPSLPPSLPPSNYICIYLLCIHLPSYLPVYLKIYHLGKGGWLFTMEENLETIQGSFVFASLNPPGSGIHMFPHVSTCFHVPGNYFISFCKWLRAHERSSHICTAVSRPCVLWL